MKKRLIHNQTTEANMIPLTEKQIEELTLQKTILYPAVVFASGFWTCILSLFFEDVYKVFSIMGILLPVSYFAFMHAMKENEKTMRQENILNSRAET